MSISRISSSTGVNITGTSGTNTISSTTAGDFVVCTIQNRTNNTDGVTSITDGGDTFISAGVKATLSITGTRATEIWYCPSVSGSVTTLTFNFSGSGTYSVRAFIYRSSLGTMRLGGGGTVNDGLSTTTASGPSITTTVNSSLCVTYICSPTFNPTAPGSGWTNQGVDANGNEIDDIINAAKGTYQDVQSVDAAARFEASAAWFYEPPQRNRATLLGCG